MKVLSALVLTASTFPLTSTTSTGYRAGPFGGGPGSRGAFAAAVSRTIRRSARCQYVPAVPPGQVVQAGTQTRSVSPGRLTVFIPVCIRPFHVLVSLCATCRGLTAAQLVSPGAV